MCKDICMHLDTFFFKSFFYFVIYGSGFFFFSFVLIWIRKTEVIYAVRGDLSKCKDDLVTFSTRTLAILKSGAASEIYILFPIVGVADPA